MYDKKCFLTETFTKIENVSVNVDDKTWPYTEILLAKNFNEYGYAYSLKIFLTKFCIQ